MKVKDDVALLAAALKSGDLERFLELKERMARAGRGFVISTEDQLFVADQDLSSFPLQNAAIYDTTFTNCTFNEGSLAGADLIECFFQECRFNRTNVRKMTTTNTSFEACTFHGVKFAQADFSGGAFYGPCCFTKCSFSRIRAQGTGWENVIVDTVRAQRCLQRHIVKGVRLPRKHRTNKK